MGTLNNNQTISVDRLQICYRLSIQSFDPICNKIMKESQAGEGQPQLSPLKKATSQNQSDYQVLGTVGKGAYGMVSLAEKGGKLYAIKRIEKKKLAKQSKEYQAFVERELLRKLNHPGIIKLAKCYQDPKHLNYVLEYCHGGDFTNFIRLNNKLITEEMRVFYVAEIVSILQYLHSVGVTHRDLKPENIMLSKDGHIKLIDFGTAEISRCTILDEKFKDDIEKQKKATGSKKLIDFPTEDDQNVEQEETSPRKRRSTFVGTCYYLSPELLEFNICEPPSDLWALGCIIYQLYYLDPPFKASTQYQLFEKIKNVEINFPKNESISEEAIDLIKKLLVKVPEDRLGSNEKQGLKWKDLKAHPYFKNVTFENLFDQKVPALKQEEYKKEEHDLKLEKLKAEIEGDHDEVFKNKEQIVYSDIVDRKTFASYSPCYLILEKGFTLLKILPNQPEPTKLAISPLREGVAAELLEESTFQIVADECKWTVRSKDAGRWVELINNQFRSKS